MVTLKGKHIELRALEPEDLNLLYAIENDESVWEISSTITPYSKYVLKQYLKNAHKDIYEAKQLRLVICEKKGKALGLIDLFDFDFTNRRAGIGILIVDQAKNKGYGSEALELLIDYCFSRLKLHQLYCNIAEDNKASIKLFTKQGFTKVGLKQDWVFSQGKFKNEILFQRINEHVL